MRSRETSSAREETLRVRSAPAAARHMARQPQPVRNPARQQPHDMRPTYQPQQRRGTLQSGQMRHPLASGASSQARAAACADLWQRIWAARVRVLIWIACVATAALATDLLSGSKVALKVSAFLFTFNFDQERVLLMTTLLMMVVGAAAAGVVFRWRLPAVVGSMLYFIVWYLSPFLARVQHPPLGPGGLKQELIPGALASMTVTLLGAALICASIGAALGVAYGELVVTPLVALALQLWRRVRHEAQGEATPLLPMLPRTGISLALGALLIYALILTSSVPGTLLTFGIEGTLYRLAPGNTATNVQAHGTVLQGTYTSAALGVSRTFYIYLPPSYSVAQAQRYPVLYMLHGSPGTPYNWIGPGKAAVTEDALLANSLMRETIVVTGDGTGPIYRFSEWGNSFDGRQRMEDAVAVDLVHYIDQHYRTLPDAADRAIGGSSEGGFGGVNIALHHPDVFGAALSMSGYFTAVGPVFGYGQGSALYRAYNSPSAYIFTPSGMRAAHAIRFVICVGSEDGSFYQDGITFSQQLRKISAHVTLLNQKGGHSWQFWAFQLGEILPLLEPPLQAASAHA